MANAHCLVLQVLPPLVVGARLVLAREGGQADGAHIVDLVTKHGVSFFVSTPSLGLVQFRDCDAGTLASLRSALFGGETMPLDLISLLAQKVGHMLLLRASRRAWQCI